MKKILAILIASVMVLAMCVNASALYSLDRLFVNQNDRVAGDAEFGAAGPDGSDVEIDPGDSLYIIGWAVDTDDGSPLAKIVYTIDDGEDIDCEGVYRDRPDVAGAFQLDPSAGIGAGFGFDSAADGGMMKLAGIEDLPDGTYEIAIKAIFEDGKEQVFEGPTGGIGVFTLIVGTGVPSEDSKLNFVIDGGDKSITAGRNEEVDIKIRLINNKTISSAKVNLIFDEDLSVVTKNGNPVVTFDIYDPDDPTASRKASLDAANHTLTLNWYTLAEEIKGNTVFATVRFKVSANAANGDFLPINAVINPNDVFDIDLNNIDYDIVSGGIKAVFTEHTEKTTYCSLDRLFVNQNDRPTGDMEFGGSVPDGSDVEIEVGDNLYIIGWAVREETVLDKIVYTIDDGDEIECEGGYRDRPDVANAFGLDASTGVGAGFGYDSAADGGMMRLAGIENLPNGTYEIEIKAVFEDGYETVFDKPGRGIGTFTLIVGTGEPDDVGTLNIVIDGADNSIKAAPGETVDVKIRLVNNKTISCAKITLEYDPMLEVALNSKGKPEVVLDIVDPNDTSVVKGINLVEDENKLILNWMSGSGEVRGDVVYATVTFRVSADAEPGAFLPITASVNPNDVFDYNMDNIDFELVTGGVKVKEPVKDPDTWLCTESANGLYSTGWWIHPAGNPAQTDWDIWMTFETPNAFDGFTMACFASTGDTPAVLQVCLLDEDDNELESQEITINGDHNSEELGYTQVYFDNVYAAGTYTIQLEFADGSHFILAQGDYSDIDVTVMGSSIAQGDDPAHGMVAARAPAVWLTGAVPPDEEPVHEGKLNIVIDGGNGDLVVAPGEEFDVKVKLVNNYGISSLKMTLNYDERLSVVYVEDENGYSVPAILNLYTYGDQVQYACSADEILLNWISGRGDIKGDITYATVRFRMPDDAAAGEFMPITADINPNDVFDGELNNVDYDIITGGVKVGGKLNIVIDGGEKAIKPGDEVDVKINLVNNKTISSAKMIIKYDEKLMIPTDVNGDPLVTLDIYDPNDISAMRAVNLSPTENALLLNWQSCEDEVKGDVTFATIRFRVADNAEFGDYLPITAEIYPNDIFDVEMNNIDFDLINGGITVGGRLNIVIDGGLEEINAGPGEEIDVKIRLVNNETISSVKLTLNYDEKLSVAKNNNGKYLIAFDIFDPDDYSAQRAWSVDEENHIAVLNWISGEDEVTGDVVYATVTFKLADNVKDGEFLSITADIDPNDIFDMEQNNVDYDIVNGGIRAINKNAEDAIYSLDRLYVNYSDRITAEAAGQPAYGPDGSDVAINVGDKLYVLGWAVCDGTSLDRIVYTIDGGEEIECSGSYRDRPDVADAFRLDASAGVGAGFGLDNNMLELSGIEDLPNGTYRIVIKAIYENGKEKVFNNPSTGVGVFDLIVGTGVPDTKLNIVIGNSDSAIKANPGDEIDVKVKLFDNDGIISLKMDLIYDERLSVVTDENGDPVVFFDICDPDDPYVSCVAVLEEETNTLLLNWLSPEAEVSGDTVFATVRFKVSEDVSADTSLYINPVVYADDVFNYELENVDFTVSRGVIDITSVLKIVIDGAQEEIEARPGEELDVKINLLNNTGISSLKMMLRYSDKLSVVMVEDEYGETVPAIIDIYDPLDNARKSVRLADDGLLLNWLLDEGEYSGDMPYATVRFKVSPDAKPGEFLNITADINPNDVFGGDLNNIDYVLSNGGIRVTSSTFAKNAMYSLDRMFVNYNNRLEGEAAYGSASPDGSDVVINAGDKIYILGWAVDDENGVPLDKIVYSIKDGESDIECSEKYRDRPDVASVFGLDASAGVGAGFGFDNDMMELSGIDELPAGTYEITIKAVFKDGGEKEFNRHTFTLVVNAGDSAGYQWLCGNEPNSYSPGWWFNPVGGPDDRYIDIHFTAEGSFSGIRGFYYCNAQDWGEAAVTVELIKNGHAIAGAELASDGDRWYDTYFGGIFGPGEYTIRYTCLYGSGITNDNWCVIAASDGNGDVTVDCNVTSTADGMYPTIMLIGAPVEEGAYDHNLVFADCGTYYEVQSCNQSASGEIVIPSVVNINGKTMPVKSIGEFAFGQCIDITSIYIPDSVTEIGNWAFYNCGSLTNIFIPSGVTSIGFETFSHCTNLTAIDVDGDNTVYSSYEGVLCSKDGTVLIAFPFAKATEYTIPDGVVEIGYSAFGQCYELTSVTFGKDVEIIGGNAFSGSGLTSVTIPEGVTYISDGAFQECYSLKKITIPASVTYIGEHIHSNDSSLKSIEVDTNNANYTSYEGVLFSKDMKTLCAYPIGKGAEYTVPDGVKIIGRSAFCNSNLTSLVLPDGLTKISGAAFWYCRKLITITIPASVTMIELQAFSGCERLENAIYFGAESQWNKKVALQEYNDELINNLIFHPEHVYDDEGDAICNVCGYERELTVYTVVFKDYDGRVLSSEEYNYGDEIVIPDEPVREDDDEFTYDFTGWDKEVSLICKGNASYKAVYEAVEKAIETEPEDTEPEDTEPEDTEPEDTEPEDTEPEDTEPEDTEPEDTEPEDTEPEDTEPEDTEPEDTEPEDTEPEDTEPEDTEPEDTEPEDTEPEDTEPEDTEPEDTEPEQPTETVQGDCNGDGEVNNKDVVFLFRYVSSDEKADDESAYDYNGDGEVNNKDVVALFRALSSDV